MQSRESQGVLQQEFQCETTAGFMTEAIESHVDTEFQDRTSHEIAADGL